MAGGASLPDPANPQQADSPDPKAWGRRAYAGKAAREQLNDASRAICEQAPDHVDDPTDPDLSDIIRQIAQGVDPHVKGSLLANLLQNGLTFREAVCWYWYRHAQLDLTEIHFAIQGYNHGGDPDTRADHVEDIAATLRTAAEKLDVDVTVDYNP
jgi:hypothetical protein